MQRLINYKVSKVYSPALALNTKCCTGFRIFCRFLLSYLGPLVFLLPKTFKYCGFEHT